MTAQRKYTEAYSTHKGPVHTQSGALGCNPSILTSFSRPYSQGVEMHAMEDVQEHGSQLLPAPPFLSPLL